MDRPIAGVYNPNQRQFIEDELRYREKLQQLYAGFGKFRNPKFILKSKIAPLFSFFFSPDSSPTHLYIRPKEVELDVDLLDKHDSFYHTTKSLLVLFQIMGIMPIQRSPPGTMTKNFVKVNNKYEPLSEFQVQNYHEQHSIGVPVYFSGLISSMDYLVLL